MAKLRGDLRFVEQAVNDTRVDVAELRAVLGMDGLQRNLAAQHAVADKGDPAQRAVAEVGDVFVATFESREPPDLAEAALQIDEPLALGGPLELGESPYRICNPCVLLAQRIEPRVALPAWST